MVSPSEVRVGSTPHITISYRREDSGVITGRIFDRLVSHYGRGSVFRDIDNIPLGVDFREHINQTLDASTVVLAIVGPHWLGPGDTWNRINEEADPVRVEVEAVLQKRLRLIPVLVFGASMPSTAELPESLKSFAYLNATRIDAGQDFDLHIERLIRALDLIIQQVPTAQVAEAQGSASQDPATPPPQAEAATRAPTSRPSFVAPAVLMALLLIGAVLAAGAYWRKTASPAGPDTPLPAVITAGRPSNGTEMVNRAPQPPSTHEPEQQRKQEEARQGGIDREKEAEAARLAEQERKEGEGLRAAEAARTAEAERRKQEEARQAELDRQKEAEAARLAEQERKQADEARAAEAERQKRAEAERQAVLEQQRRQEAERQRQRTEVAEREQRGYSAAKGNVAGLRVYLSTCSLCAYDSDARAEIVKLEAAAQEEQSFAAAHGNLYALRSYLSSCRICAFENAAKAELDKIQTTAKEEETFNAARGNLYALRGYLDECRICAFGNTARDEIAKLSVPASRPKRVSSITLCGRSVDYAIDPNNSEPIKALLGVWTGATWTARICGALVVEGRDSDGTVRIKYVYGPLPGSAFPWRQMRGTAAFENGQLSFRDDEGGSFIFRPGGPNTLRAQFTSARGAKLEAVLTREMSSVP